MQRRKKQGLFGKGLTEKKKHINCGNSRNAKVVALTNLNAFAADNFSVTQMVQFVLDRIVNIVRKGKKAGYQNEIIYDCHTRRIPFMLYSKGEIDKAGWPDISWLIAKVRCPDFIILDPDLLAFYQMTKS